MDHAVCFECVDDEHLSNIIQDQGKPLPCSVCGETVNNAFTVEELGQLLEPIMREHFSLGPTVKKFGEDDSEWWEQDGEPMSSAVQQVLGQYFDFEDEIVDAVIEAEDCWPPDGDECFWDKLNSYVETRVRLGNYFAEWGQTLDELKHSRRFFNSAAETFFRKLFDGVEDIKEHTGQRFRPVVRELATRTKLFRARVCDTHALLKNMYQDPFRHIGPPPKNKARAGRMNADGVVVFYGALEQDTCLAEMRPALGHELAIIAVETTKPLRVLDFSRLERAYGGKPLSYFQSNFTEQVEKRAFLRRLHRLISQPIVPGREADYLITQTMSEYLAHVHNEPFDGILFAPAQRETGTNVVLFAERNLMTDVTAEAFRVSYIPDSISLFSTTSIKYKHRKLDVIVPENGTPWIHSDHGEIDDDWTYR